MLNLKKAGMIVTAGLVGLFIGYNIHLSRFIQQHKSRETPSIFVEYDWNNGIDVRHHKRIVKNTTPKESLEFLLSQVPPKYYEGKTIYICHFDLKRDRKYGFVHPFRKDLVFIDERCLVSNIINDGLYHELGHLANPSPLFRTRRAIEEQQAKAFEDNRIKDNQRYPLANYNARYLNFKDFGRIYGIL